METHIVSILADHRHLWILYSSIGTSVVSRMSAPRGRQFCVHNVSVKYVITVMLAGRPPQYWGLADGRRVMLCDTWCYNPSQCGMNSKCSGSRGRHVRSALMQEQLI